jgi:2-keto-4-pentenoate hydratase
MTPETDPVDAVAQSLLRAHRGGPLADDQALRGQLASAEQAYAVQERLLDALGEPHGCPRFWKSGAFSRAEPLKHSPLPAAGVRPSGSHLRDLGLHHHWIEAEVALRIRREVTPDEAQGITLQDARALADGMCASIELVDSRWAGARDAAPLLKLADFLLHGALVLGGFVPFSARAWEQQECQVRIGKSVARLFRGTAGQLIRSRRLFANPCTRHR